MWQRTICSAPILAKFLLFFVIFQPLWCHTEALEDPNRPVNLRFPRGAWRTLQKWKKSTQHGDMALSRGPTFLGPSTT